MASRPKATSPVKDPFVSVRQPPRRQPAVGDIWLLPARHVRSLKPGKRGAVAFCLLAIAEPDQQEGTARIHYVAGSRQRSSRKTVRVSPVEGVALEETTYFKFWASRSLAPPTIMSDGSWRGCLPAERRSEIEEAIRDSNLVALKLLLGRQQ